MKESERGPGVALFLCCFLSWRHSFRGKSDHPTEQTKKTFLLRFLNVLEQYGSTGDMYIVVTVVVVVERTKHASACISNMLYLGSGVWQLRILATFLMPGH